MDSILTSVGIALGGGAVGAAVVIVVLLAARGAVLSGVQQAAARELETMRATFTDSLEERRRTFVREIERERQDSLRALEFFKAELGEKAEMRRQVIARRLTALEEIAAAGEPLVRELAPNSTVRDVSAKVSVLNRFTGLMRQHSHLLSAGLQRHFFGCVAKIEAALEKSKNQSQFDDMGEAWKASEDLMKRVRSELGIEDDAPLSGRVS
jgi:hypothetical protein